LAKLPEEFAPQGPKLSRFVMRPPPPLTPRLFPDEARFALRLSLLCGVAEFGAWTVLTASGARRELLLLAALRLLRPMWAKVGTRLPRPAIAIVLMLAGALGFRWAWLAGFLALGDLCASCIGDAITVERRAAAYTRLDMAQALGGALGFAVGSAYPSPWWMAVLLIGAVGLPDLRDRGTPRSAWPLQAYLGALKTPLGAQLTALALAGGVLATPVEMSAWAMVLLPLLGMAVAARLEAWMPNAAWLPRIALVLAIAGRLYPPLRPVAMGAMFAAIPAAVARGAGEMERPLISSMALTALIAGAALGAVLGY